MNPEEYVAHDALSLAALVRKGAVSAAELLECALSRADHTEPLLNAIAHRLDDAARGQVRQLKAEGPFAGVPFLVKDAGAAVAGAPMTGGSRLFADQRSDTDTTLVARYRACGLQIIGKTNTPELGLSFTTEPLAQGPTRNPWNPSCSPGGSSGGSAAAVAAGVVPIAHGTDGAGSIRLPASHCGLFGFKPSRMRTPVGPVNGESLYGLSAAHALSRSVRDNAALLDATCGAEPGDPYAAPPRLSSYSAETDRDPASLRIGFSTHSPTGSPVDAECAAAVRRAALLCESLGHSVEESALDYDAHAVRSAWRLIAGVSTALYVRNAEEARSSPSLTGLLEPVNAAWVAQAERYSALDFAQAIDEVRRAGRSVGRSFERFDVFLTPCAAAPPPLLGVLAGLDEDLDAFYERFWNHGPFTAIYNVTGCPAMSVPLGSSAAGLPLGAHFGAALGQDGVLFALAGQLERARPWSYEIPFARALTPLPRVA
ncbi:MAG TPA: amidase [Steroidobacteraceae bacterium]|nr:amidase [Steroidobacteraceae bacterium]